LRQGIKYKNSLKVFAPFSIANLSELSKQQHTPRKLSPLSREGLQQFKLENATKHQSADCRPNEANSPTAGLQHMLPGRLT
jgi:hypothetical protein